MEFTDYIETKNRMTEKCNVDCCECPFGPEHNGTLLNCVTFEATHPETAEALVKNWGEEHPAKTRQSEFLKLFSNAPMKGKLVDICPVTVDEDYNCDAHQDCSACRKAFWNAEINEYNDEIKETREEYKIEEK